MSGLLSSCALTPYAAWRWVRRRNRGGRPPPAQLKLSLQLISAAAASPHPGRLLADRRFAQNGWLN